MGWSIGYDHNNDRDIGYGVPSICDHPGCEKRIDRGLSYVCGGVPYGGERGCGLHFCSNHLFLPLRGRQRCERCDKRRKPFTPKPDVREWVNHKLTHESWAEWRAAHPEKVAELQAALPSAVVHGEAGDADE